MTDSLDEIIVIKSTFNKTPGLIYKIEPCPDEKGRWAKCVRPVNQQGDMILSEDDIKAQSKGATFLPQGVPIEVYHGITFDLSNDIEAAKWEAIKNSKMIAKERFERDINGNTVIDGAPSVEDRYGNPHGTFGVAELYIERPGKVAKAKNDTRKRILKAMNLVNEDNLEHMILIGKLFEKNLSNANANDVVDFLMTKAEKEPDTIIKYYEAQESKVRLLIIMAQEKKVIDHRKDGFYYGDIKLGSTLDYVSDVLKDNKEMYENIKKETFPNLENKTTKKG